jgi:hypothetical protein
MVTSSMISKAHVARGPLTDRVRSGSVSLDLGTGPVCSPCEPARVGHDAICVREWCQMPANVQPVTLDVRNGPNMTLIRQVEGAECQCWLFEKGASVKAGCP